MANCPIHVGESFLFVASGGGGWGDPLKRPPEKVLEDVVDEYVSIESAANDYGVIIDKKTMKFDTKKTTAKRKRLAKSKEYRKRLQGIRFDYLPIRYRMYGRNGRS